MKLNHKSTNGSWDVYRQLELIPESVSRTVERPNHLVSGLNFCWKVLLALLIDELVEEQRVEYLDRCWSLNEFGKGELSAPNSLQRLWVLME